MPEVMTTKSETTKTRASARAARPQPTAAREVHVHEVRGTGRYQLIDDGCLVVELVGCDELMAHRIAGFLSGDHGALVVATRSLVQAVDGLDKTYPTERECERAWERLDVAAGAARRALRKAR